MTGLVDAGHSSQCKKLTEAAHILNTQTNKMGSGIVFRAPEKEMTSTLQISIRKVREMAVWKTLNSLF